MLSLLYELIEHHPIKSYESIKYFSFRFNEYIY